MSVSRNKQLGALIEILSDPYGETVQDVRAIGGELTVDTLTVAYEHGYFPWPHEDYPMLWFGPQKRGVLDFKKMHQPRSFRKWYRKNANRFEIRFNQNFQDVITECQLQVRKGQDGTWITDEIIQAYTQMFFVGRAICCEVYENQKLVAGIYGIQTEKYVSLESMFHRIDHGSKVALVEMIQYLKNQGHQWVDIQMVSNVSESFGGQYISRQRFVKMIGY